MIKPVFSKIFRSQKYLQLKIFIDWTNIIQLKETLLHVLTLIELKSKQ